MMIIIVLLSGTLTSAEAQQVRTPPLIDFEDEATAAMDFLSKEDPNSSTIIDYIKNRKPFDPEGNSQKQQILEELHRVERELHGKQQQAQQVAAAAAAAAAASNHVFQYQIPQDQCLAQQGGASQQTSLTPVMNFDLAMSQQKQGIFSFNPQPTSGSLKLYIFVFAGLGYSTVGTTQQSQLPFYSGMSNALSSSQSPQFVTPTSQTQGQQPGAPAFYFTPIATSVPPLAVSVAASGTSMANGGIVSAPTAPGLGTLVPASALTAQPIKFQSVADVSQVS